MRPQAEPGRWLWRNATLMEANLPKTLVLLCVAVAAIVGAAEALPPLNVLWLYADVGMPDTTLGWRLRALGDSVEYYDVRLATPTLDELLPYDAVGTHSAARFADPNALGNILADYVDSGGGIVLANFCFADDGFGLTGRVMTGDYATLTLGSAMFVTQSLGWYDPAHPVMSGVTSVQDYYRTVPSLCPGAESVANWADGLPYAGVSANQKVVGLNQYPGAYPDPDRQGDWALMIHNALGFVSGAVPSIEEPGRRELPGFALTIGPNPARQTATARCSVPAGSLVRLAVYDQAGRLVQTCPSSSLSAGVWSLDVAALRQGVYFCRLTSGGHALSRKLAVER
jgi:hypothetical protein